MSLGRNHVVNRADLVEPRRGPCTVEEYDLTCVVPPGSIATLDGYGNIVIDVPMTAHSYRLPGGQRFNAPCHSNRRRARDTMPPKQFATLLILVGLCGSYPTVADAVHSGTGFAVADGSSVITNFHVVDGCKSVHIANVGVGLIKTVDPANDIAIIQPPRPISRPLRFRTGDPLKPGEDIIVIGFPLRGLLSSSPTVTTGIVSSLAGLRDDRTRFQISAPVQPGNSGGPVLDKSGNVVGMVVSKLNVLRIARMTGDIPQNVNFAIPVSIIASVLDANSVKYQVGTSDSGKSAAEIVSAAAPGVVALKCMARGKEAATTDVPAGPTPPARGGYGAIALGRGDR